MAVASSAVRLNPARASSPRHGWAVAATAMLLLLAAAPAQAEPKPTVKQLKKELTALQKDSDKLITEYYNSRIAHQKAESAEKSAKEKLAAAQEVYDRHSTELRAMAVARYIGGDPGAMALLAGGQDPATLLSRMALTQHVIDEEEAVLRGYAEVRDARGRAEQEAADRAEELERTVGDLEERKEKAEKQIEKIKDRIDLLYTAPGIRRPDGTWVPQLPQGPTTSRPGWRWSRSSSRSGSRCRTGSGATARSRTAASTRSGGPATSC
ncbi:coiled-coil domain-containing protein [Nonomuraea rubra]|uniref:coiled-coil domain-containing protein n=1 Tax=Nonomuraea rubra TaxID=46180 RepID=UPI0036209D3F